MAIHMVLLMAPKGPPKVQLPHKGHPPLGLYLRFRLIPNAALEHVHKGPPLAREGA